VQKLDGYIRVSQTRGREEVLRSPDVQKQAITTWVEHHVDKDGTPKYKVGKWFVELDKSGGKMAREELDEIMRRVRAGESDGIVVYKLDRFARSLVGGLVWLKELDDAGGVFACLDPSGLDPSDKTGKLLLSIMLSLAESELDRARENYRIARRNAVERGVAVSAHTPFGYRREPIGKLNKQGMDRAHIDDVGGKLFPDEDGVDGYPATAPFLREIFERRADGASLGELQRWLRESPVGHMRQWPAQGIATIIRNDVYLGTLTFTATEAEKRQGKTDQKVRKAHEPLVTPELWRAAQRPARKHTAVRLRPDTMLKGFVRCANCRYVMALQPNSHKDGATKFSYRCGRCKEAGRPGHSAIAADVLEVIEQRMWKFVGDFKATEATENVAAADEHVARTRDKHQEWLRDKDLALKHGYTEDDYYKELGRRAAAERLAEAEHDKLLAVLPDEAARDVAMDPDFRDTYYHAPIEERREYVTKLIRHVFVAPGRTTSEPMDRRVDVVWFDDDREVDVPTPGNKLFESRPWPMPEIESDFVDAPELAAEAGVTLAFVNFHRKQLHMRQRVKRGRRVFEREPALEAIREILDERDYVAEMKALLADGTWRTATEIALPRDAGIGSNEKTLNPILADASPDHFVSRTGDAARALGRSPKAVLWQLRDGQSG
jgi:DNA invertase Pin-like site-specific DNA recombinase